MSSLSLFIHGLLLVGLYSGYGLLQEKIIKGSYGPQGEHFASSSLLILINRIFAIGLAVGIVAWTNRGRREPLSRALAPKSPLKQYAVVALYNFLSSTCQFQALKVVSFTTASLAKCTKTLPVLIVGYLVHSKVAKTREWVASIVMVIGCVLYFSTLRTGPSPLDDDDAFMDAALGLIFLSGYLFFDGLTSTSQEKYFGRTSSSTDPFGADSPVLQQMIWVNLFTCLASVGGLLVDAGAETLVPSVTLLVKSGWLQLDILGLSATAAVGLIVLLNTIASFGALTSSLLMSIRQFTGIALNAGVFKHFRSVALQGWCGVGLVASAVVIHLNRTWDEPEELSSRYEALDLIDEAEDEAKEGYGRGRIVSASSSRSPSPTGTPLPAYSAAWSPPLPSSLPPPHGCSSSRPFTPRQFLLQYAIPLSFPVLFSALVYLLDPDSNAAILRPDYDEYASTDGLEGGDWDRSFYEAVAPICNLTKPVPWQGSRRTALASFPRSGNSFMRELIERATGFQSSTVTYCDQALVHAFAGECDHDANFLVKTHFPERVSDVTAENDYLIEYSFDQAVHLIRNPLDSIYSGYMMAHVPKTSDGAQDHSARLDIGLLGSTEAQREDVLERAAVWAAHVRFWSQDAQVPAHLVRYEDLMENRLATLMGVISFLLPSSQLPPLNDIACLVEVDEEREAYKSRKAPAFNSFDLFTPQLRVQVVEILKDGWCRYGYDQLLRAKKGETEVDEICRK